MSKLEALKQMVAAEKKTEAANAKVREEWIGKPMADFITSTDPLTGSITMFLPVLAMSKAGGLGIYIEVPKFEGLHNRFEMSLRSKDGRPSEVDRYKATEQYRGGLIKVYTTDEVTKQGDTMLHWSGLEKLETLDRVKSVAVGKPASPQYLRTLRHKAEELLHNK